MCNVALEEKTTNVRYGYDFRNYPVSRLSEEATVMAKMTIVLMVMTIVFVPFAAATSTESIAKRSLVQHRRPILVRGEALCKQFHPFLCKESNAGNSCGRHFKQGMGKAGEERCLMMKNQPAWLELLQ